MDSIADFLTIIRNGYLAKKDTVSANQSKFRLEIARILKEEGYIVDYSVVAAEPVSQIVLTLRYFEKGLPAVTGIKKITKPSVRIYSGFHNIKDVMAGSGTTIVSTPAGLLTGKQAKEKHLGGEVICQIW